MTKKQRNRRRHKHMPTVHQGIQVGDRVILKMGDPIFPGRRGDVIEVFGEHGHTTVRIALDSKGVATSYPRIRRMLADVVQIERGTSRVPAPMHQVDTNIYNSVFG